MLPFQGGGVGVIAALVRLLSPVPTPPGMALLTQECPACAHPPVETSTCSSKPPPPQHCLVALPEACPGGSSHCLGILSLPSTGK